MHTKTRCLEFICGYVWCRVERELFHTTKDSTVVDIIIPKVWFGLRCSKDPEIDLDRDTKHQLAERIRRDVLEYYPKWTADVITIAAQEQYIKIVVRLQDRTAEIPHSDVVGVIRDLKSMLHRDIQGLPEGQDMSIYPHLTSEDLQELCTNIGLDYHNLEG